MKIIYNILFTNGDMGIDAGTVKCMIRRLEVHLMLICLL